MPPPDRRRLASRRRASRRRTRGSSRASRTAVPRRSSSDADEALVHELADAGRRPRRRSPPPGRRRPRPSRARTRRGTPTADRAAAARRRRAGRSSRRSPRGASAGAPAGRATRPSSEARWCSRRARIWSGVSSLIRAAASSIASGIPWRRPAIPATAGALAFVTAKPGLTARRPRDEQAHRLVLVERLEVEFAQRAREVQPLDLGQAARVGRRRQPRDRVLLLARDVQRDARRDQADDVRAAAQELGDRGPGGDDLLEVVEDQQDVRRRRCRPTTARRRTRAALSASPSVRAIVGATSVRIADGVQGDEPDPVREVLGGRGGDLERQPRLAGPARPGEGQQPGPIAAARRPRPARARGRRTSSAGSAGCSAGRRASGAAGSRLAGRRRRPGRAAPACPGPCSRCSPRSRRRDAVGSDAVDEGSRRVRCQDLAAVRDGRDPGGAVDVESRPGCRRPAAAPPECRPIRTRTRRRPARLRRPGRAGPAMAAATRLARLGKTTKNESPSVPCSTPPWAVKARRRSARWRSRSSP